MLFTSYLNNVLYFIKVNIVHLERNFFISGTSYNL